MEEGSEAATMAAAAAPSIITVNVQFCGQKFPISINHDSTIKELKSHLRPLTNVIPRGQKLICKGKVLADNMSLKSLKIANGSKVMLVATQGLHQGDGPITKDAKKDQSVSRVTVYKPTTNTMDRWKITGVVAFSECGLKKLGNAASAEVATVLKGDYTCPEYRGLEEGLPMIDNLQKVYRPESMLKL